VVLTAKVITGSHYIISCVQAIHPGNHEWMIIIKSINIMG